MTLCDFNNPSLTCPTCGYRAKRLPTYRNCAPPPLPPPWRPVMVGDLVEKALTSVGVTKERVERLTRTAGKPGGCGCGARKRWLNDRGAEMQRAVRAAVQKIGKFYFSD